MTHYYVLDGHTPMPASFEATRPLWDEPARQRVAFTDLGDLGTVSTVFLIIDHNMDPAGTPVLFETLVRDGPFGNEMSRYHTWEEAEAGHAAMVEQIRRQAGEMQP